MQTAFPFADPATDLRAALYDLFEAWVLHRMQSNSRARHEKPLREESIKVYREMWEAFANYCAQRGIAIADLQDTDIETFLRTRGASGAGPSKRISTKGTELSTRYAWRMLMLIDRLSQFQAIRSEVEVNTAARKLMQRDEYRYANARLSDPLPDYFSDAQAKHLIAYLTAIQPMSASTSAVSWKEVRDRTALALMLGGGCTPGDVRHLALDGVVTAGGRKAGVPWKLAIPGNGNSPARETPIASWAGQLLLYWLKIRQEQGLQGDTLFPSTAAGKPWSHTACYNACKAVLAQAGIEQHAGGVFRLRHTFALRQLSKGKTEREVAKWLGLADIESMAPYRRIVMHPVGVI